MTASRAPLPRIETRPVSRPLTQRRAKPKPTSQTQLLHRLQLLQNLAVGSVVLLTGCVFVLYAWTVYVQKRWNQQYSKLEYLKQLEGRLINATEALQHDRIQQAWEEGKLLRETPDRIIFIEAQPPRPPIQPPTPSPDPAPQLPIAY
ncbi:MAG: hypothetical protein RMK91_03370 [Pseudanabaenaceae cyanobacterium SKYGB_i_bin29]|nr:hypothetical protein [Pseudanabaenaceae cyanobacterium SKYG29]MDW8420884.1 hypothetical protein [Pseudanabaenaceae cyanobacterium SKYGB_i_bin29]